MRAVLEKFVTDLNDIHEGEYGDFMRKANQHIIELRSEMRNLHNSEVNNKIDEIQNYVQFYPTWMIESTRDKAIHDAQEIDEMISAHTQSEEMLH